MFTNGPVEIYLSFFCLDVAQVLMNGALNGLQK